MPQLRFYVTEQLGPRQALTPEGFLLCEAVPIARTGVLLYGPNETPVSTGPDGMVRIERDPEEVFRPEAMASFVGKPVTIDHPDDDVTPANWAELAVGTVVNVRRGEGIEDDCLLGDLLITRQEAIDLVRSNSNYQVSCGYDSNYEELAPGVGRQHSIIGNHVALVDQGRCGPRCSIKDRDTIRTVTGGTTPGVTPMTTKKTTVLDRIRAAFKNRDEGAMNAALEEAQGTMTPLSTMAGEGGSTDAAEPTMGETHIHLHVPGANPPADVTKPAGSLPGTGETKVTSAADQRTYDEEGMKKWMDDAEARFGSLEAGHAAILKKLDELGDMIPGKATGDDNGSAEGKTGSTFGEGEPDKEIEGELKEEAPEGTGDEAVKARDSAYLEESFHETLALAEVLAPGMKFPTYDKALRPAQTLDAICKVRAKALDLAFETTEGADIINTIGGRSVNLATMSCGAKRVLFKAAAAMKKARNNDRSRHPGALPAAASAVKSPTNAAELNRLNAEFYAKLHQTSR